MGSNVKAEALLEFFFELLGEVVGRFKNRSAVVTNQMLVNVVFKVVDRSAVAKMDVFHDPEFFKRVQRPIHRR